MVLVTAIIVTVGISIILGSVIVDKHLTNKERKNIKTEEDLRDFDIKILMRSQLGHPMIRLFQEPTFRNQKNL